MEKSKNYISMQDDDLKKIKNYVSKFESLIEDKDYLELEYIAECFMCSLRDIAANMKRETRKEVLHRCADGMGITVQKKDSILEVTLPLILPTKSKTKTDYLFEPLFVANDRNKNMKKMLAIGSDYDNIFFLDSSKFASQQFKYLIDGKTQSKVDKGIDGKFSASNKFNKYYSETADGTVILNCTNCNLASMRFVKEAGVQKGRRVNIICFHFQLPYLQEYFGWDDNVKYYQMNQADIL